MTPRMLPTALLLATLTACQDPVPGDDSAAPAEVERAESILFVLIDTLRADHTSLHGHRLGRTTTPFLDELAADSYVFGRAYSPASWTRASVASIFTSRVPSSHGCEARDGYLSDELVTLAEALDFAGFDTRAVVTNGNVTAQYGFDQGFDHYERHTDFPRNSYSDAAKLTEPVLHAIDRMGAGPNFLYLHYVDPHDPFLERPSTDFDPDYAGPMTGSREDLDRYRWEEPPEPAMKQRVIDLYDGEILWFDHELRRLVGELEKRGVLDDTWLVFTSDHGEGLWDHRIQSHGQEVFEEQVLVPLVVRPPGGLPQRVDVPDPISLIDVAPTLLESVGVPIPPSFEGRSWAAWMEGRGEPPVRPVVIDEKLDNVHLAAIVDGHHKVILDFQLDGAGFGPVRSTQLREALYFDLAANPDEDPERAVDLRSERSAEGKRLHGQLVQLLDAAEQRAAELTDDGAPLTESDDLAAELRALGYLGDAMPRDARAAHRCDATCPTPCPHAQGDG